VVGLVGLAEVGGIGKDAGAVLLHPQQRGAGVETARESDADFLALGQAFQDRTHGASNRSKWLMSFECREYQNPRISARVISDYGLHGRLFADLAAAPALQRPVSRPRQPGQRGVDTGIG